MADQASCGASLYRGGDDGPQRQGDPHGGLHVIAEGEDGPRHQGDPRSGPREDGPRHQGDPRSGLREDGPRHQGDPRSGLREDGLRHQGDPRSGLREDGPRHQSDPRSGLRENGLRRQGDPRSRLREDGRQHQGDLRSGLREDGRQHQGDPRSGLREDDRQHQGDPRGSGRSGFGQSADGLTGGEGRVSGGFHDVPPGLLGVSEQSEQEARGTRPGMEQDGRNVRPRLSEGPAEDNVLRMPAGPPTVYGPSISATKCESLAGPVGVEAVRLESQELPQGAAEPTPSMTTSERLLETLAQGMQQLQKAQLDHLERTDRKREEETPEQCKPGTSTFPALPSPSGNESAVALQDWIEVIDGPLRDISDSSSWWWDSVKQRAQESYKKWVASGPYERLSLKPPTAEDLEQGKFSRLSARTAGMMLQAMSGVVRAEMVARAITRSPVALLFRLFTMYQPGGESEKAYILQYLVSPPKAQTATELVAVLRQWERLLFL